MAEFRAALQLQPDYESAEHHLANRLADSGRLDEAIAHYQAAARLDPNHAENYNGLGICYAMQGNYAEAERQFREAVRLRPGHSGAQSNLGNALGAQNRLEEAIPHYQKALEADPNVRFHSLADPDFEHLRESAGYVALVEPPRSYDDEFGAGDDIDDEEGLDDFDDTGSEPNPPHAG